jgi:hypothetical protein
VKRGPDNVRYLEQFGRHMLARSFTARDPDHTLAAVATRSHIAFEIYAGFVQLKGTMLSLLRFDLVDRLGGSDDDPNCVRWDRRFRFGPHRLHKPYDPAQRGFAGVCSERLLMLPLEQLRVAGREPPHRRRVGGFTCSPIMSTATRKMRIRSTSKCGPLPAEKLYQLTVRE